VFRAPRRCAPPSLGITALQYWAAMFQEILSWSPCLSTTRGHHERWKGILRSTCLSSGTQAKKPGFQQWFVSSFCPAVQRYCEENDLEPRVLLVLDNASGHPENLDSLRSLLPVEVGVPSTKYDFIDSTNGSERHFKLQALLPATHF
jgi:hypothetical protein